jgi:hypothetical protein
MASSLEEGVEVVGYPDGGEGQGDRDEAMLRLQRTERPMLIVRK